MKQCRAKDQQAQQTPDSADDSHCPPDIIIRKPQSPEDAFTFRAVSAIEIEGAADSWYHILPAHMTQSSLVNLCMRALVFSSEWARGVPGSSLLQCYHALTAALYGVRHTMSTPHKMLSDETLVAIAALSPLEGVLGSHALVMPPHLEGVVAIVTSRPPGTEVSDVTRNILDYCFGDIAVMACMRGCPNPLEQLERSYYELSNPSNASAAARLKALACEQTLKMPRLLALVRSLRQRKGDTAAPAIVLANELMNLQDVTAENELLHKVHIRSTREAKDSAISKFSFRFDSVVEYEATIRYWSTRLFLFRIIWRLASLEESSPSLLDNLQPRFDLEAEIRRLASNVLMSSEEARTFKMRGRRRLFALSMISLWGTFDEVPGCLPKGVDRLQARSWLRSNTNFALMRYAAFTNKDMDDAADLFVGGMQIPGYNLISEISADEYHQQF